MEEEYRMQKAHSDVKRASLKANGVQPSETDVSQMMIYEDGTVGRSSTDDDSSTRAVVSPTPKDDPHGSSLHVNNNIPTIRISTESDRDLDDEATDDVGIDEDEIKQNGIHNGAALEKPVQAAAGEDDADGDTLSAAEPFSFSNKRLCERWLDNLFMVLYEVCCPCSVPVLWTYVKRQGSEGMDNFQGRGGTFQNATSCVP